jgi:hypothetical protein
VYRGVFGATVGYGDSNSNVFRTRLRIFGKDVEVPVLLEDPGISQFELGVGLTAIPIFLNEALVREFALRVFVESLEIGMGGRGIEVEVRLLHVFAMVPLRSGQPEQALFEYWVSLIPKRQREAKPALPVTDPQQSVLTPAVSAATGLIMGEVFPDVAAVRVILADRPPLPLSQVRTPALPVLGTTRVVC